MPNFLLIFALMKTDIIPGGAPLAALFLILCTLLCPGLAARDSADTLRAANYLYVGGTSRGLQHGFGICRYTNGNVYTGWWNMGYKEGLGLMQFADSTMSYGRWERGELTEIPDQAFRTGDRVYGLDVSKYQREIDWRRLALPSSKRGLLTRSGDCLQPVMFIIVKSTQGTNLRNAYFDQQFEGARRHGIVRGAYHFLSPNSSGREQARYYIANTPLVSGDMPPVLDLEIKHSVMRRQHRKILRIAREWLRAVEDHYGVKPIIYTYDNYYRDYLHGHGFDDYEFWVANYRERPRNRDCVIWQFADDGKAFGIGHDVDLNLFNGGDYRAFLEWLAEKGIQ